MDWRERAQAMAEARAQVHDTYKIPVMFSADSGVTWRVVFCRFHESVNPDGVRVGSGSAQITISSSNPVAIFRQAEVPDLNSKTAIVSVLPGKCYQVAKAAPADRYGYLVVNMDPAPKLKVGEYPVPDWETL